MILFLSGDWKNPGGKNIPLLVFYGHGLSRFSFNHSKISLFLSTVLYCKPPSSPAWTFISVPFQSALRRVDDLEVHVRTGHSCAPSLPRLHVSQGLLSGCPHPYLSSLLSYYFPDLRISCGSALLLHVPEPMRPLFPLSLECYPPPNIYVSLMSQGLCWHVPFSLKLSPAVLFRSQSRPIVPSVFVLFSFPLKHF